MRRRLRSRLAGGAAAGPNGPIPLPPMETRMSKRLALLAAAAIAAFSAVATAPLYAQMSEKTVTVGGAPMYPSKNIIQNAVNSKDHTTLVAAVKAAGLVDTLNGPGPFTVFAPTDAAFAKLPAGTVESLLKPENKARLTAILTYHVVPGRVMAADVVKLKQAKTVNGQMIAVKANGEAITLNSAKVTESDVVATNGVIHVIDTVILPPNG